MLPVMPLLFPLRTSVPAPFLSKELVKLPTVSSAMVPLKVSVLVAATLMSVATRAVPALTKATFCAEMVASFVALIAPTT